MNGHCKILPLLAPEDGRVILPNDGIPRRTEGKSMSRALPAPVYQHTFSAAANTYGGTGSTITRNTTDHVSGTAAIIVTPSSPTGAFNYAWIASPSTFTPFDITNKNFRIRFRVKYGAPGSTYDSNTFGRIDLIMRVAATNKLRTYVIAQSSPVSPIVTDQWIEAGGYCSTFTTPATATAGDLQIIDHFRLLINPRTDAPNGYQKAIVEFDLLEWYAPPTDKAKLCIVIDDGYAQNFDRDGIGNSLSCQSIADAMGFPLTHALMVGGIGSGNKMSWDQARMIESVSLRRASGLYGEDDDEYINMVPGVCVNHSFGHDADTASSASNACNGVQSGSDTQITSPTDIFLANMVAVYVYTGTGTSPFGVFKIKSRIDSKNVTIDGVHEFSNRTVTASPRWASATYTADPVATLAHWIADMYAGSAKMNAEGLTRGSRVFVSPAGAWNDNAGPGVLGKYCDLWRNTGGTNYLGEPIFAVRGQVGDPRWFISSSAPDPISNMGDTAHVTKDLLTVAVAEHSVCVLYWHGANYLADATNDTNVTYFKEFMAHVKSLHDTSGTADSGTIATLVDADRTETSDVFAGKMLRITAGTNAGDSSMITSFNPATKTFTVALPFLSPIDNTSVYTIEGGGFLDYVALDELCGLEVA